MSVLSTASPAALRAAGHRLRAEASSVAELTRRLGDAQPSADAWAGVAALEHGARVESVSRTLLTLQQPVLELGDLLGELAERLEVAQREGARLRRRADELREQVQALARLLVDTLDPALEQSRRERIIQLEELEAAARARLADLEDEVDALVAKAAGMVEDSWVSDLAQDVRSLVAVGQGLYQGLKASRQVRASIALMRLTAKRARAVDLAARAVLSPQIRELAMLVRKVPWWARPVGPIGFIGIPLAVGRTAVPDLINGNGYPGWRGHATRFFAGGAIVGSIALVRPMSPMQVGAGGAAIGSYQLWLGGNTLYDHPRATKMVGLYLLEQAKDDAQEVGHILSEVVTDPRVSRWWVPPLVPDPIGQELVDQVAQRSRDYLDDLDIGGVPSLEDLTETWRQRVREVGVPVRLPDLPVPDLPRLPAIDLPGSWW